IYVKTDSSSGWQHYQSGALRSRSQRDGLKDLFAIDVTIPAGDSIMIYERNVFDFKFTGLSRENVVFEFMNNELVMHQQRANHIWSLWFVFVLWMFLLAVIINLYFFKIVKEKEFLYFALVLFFSGLVSLHNLGNVILPDHPKALFYLIMFGVIVTYYAEFNF